MRRQHLLEAWNRISQMIFDKDTPEAQRISIRRAFYAGATALFGLQMRELNVEEGLEPTDEDLKMMDDIHEELIEFSKKVVKREA